MASRPEAISRASVFSLTLANCAASALVRITLFPLLWRYRSFCEPCAALLGWFSRSVM